MSKKWRLVQKCETPAEAELLREVMVDYYGEEHIAFRAEGARVELMSITYGGTSLSGKTTLVSVFHKTLRACRVSYAKQGHCPLDVLQLAICATTDPVAKAALADRLEEMGLDDLAGRLRAPRESDGEGALRRIATYADERASDPDKYGIGMETVKVLDFISAAAHVALRGQEKA